MKGTLALLFLGAAAPMLQGVANSFVPARFSPDLSLLLVIAVGLYWKSAAGGLVISAVVGFMADLLSGSLLGENALLRVLAFGVARLASRQLNLRGPLPQAVFVLFFTAVNALGIGLLNAFFTSGGGFDLLMLRRLLPHACVNALFAPLLASAIGRVAIALGDDESGRRPLRLEPRRRAV